jgi:AsmA family protein
VRLLLSVLALFALLLAGLATFWWLGGPDTHRWLARWALELATGHEVQVDGTLEVEIGAEPLLRLTGLRIDNPPWAESSALVQVEQAEISVALLPLLRGVLALPLVSLQGVIVALETAPDGRQSWRSDGTPAELRLPSIDRLSMEDVTVTYHDRRDGRRIRVHVAGLDQRDDASGAIRLEGRGDINGEAFEIVGTTGRPTETFAAVPLDLAIRLPSIDVRLTGTLAEARLEARCPSLLAAAKAWNLPLPLDAQVTLDARLRGGVAAPVFEEIEAAVQGPGDSRLTIGGALQIATVGGLRLERFDLDSTVTVPDPSSLAAPFGLDASWLGASQGSAKLSLSNGRIEASRLEIDAGLGALRLEGNGAIGRLTADGALQLTPDVAFTATAARSKPALARIDPRIPELGPIRASGRFAGGDGHYRLDQLAVDVGPPGRQAISARGHIGDVGGLQQLALAGSFNLATPDLLALLGVQESRDIGRLEGRFELSDADGSIGIEHIEAVIRETSLLTLTLEGAVDNLMSRDEIVVQASLDVPSVASLAEAFGAGGAPPQPLRFDGKLAGGERGFDADGSATLGETRFDGVLAADFHGARPSFRGRLHSPHLRLVDIGLTPAVAGAPSQADHAAAVANRRLFGTEPVPLDGLQKFDLDLDVEIESVEGVALAIGHTKAHVTLTDSELRISPLEFDVVGGYAAVNAEVDAREPAPEWRLQAKADDVQLGDVWRQLETEVPLRGELDLILDLQASGRSPRDLASSLAGTLDVALQRGQIRSRLFGLTTMNPVRWLVAESTRRGYSRIDCFVARFQGEGGVANLQALMLDTPSVIAEGEGYIDFARETLNLRIRPSPKERSLIELATPFTIGGSLASPTVKASAAGATARALGRVVVSPVNLLGALLPIVGDSGRDQQNPCLNLRPSGTLP